MAVQYIQQKGAKVIENNWHTRFGEIDIIATKYNKLHFIEVKLKVGEHFGSPEEMITKRKIHQIKKTAEMYLLKNKEVANKFSRYQIDAVAIVLDEKGNVSRINHYENIEY